MYGHGSEHLPIANDLRYGFGVKHRSSLDLMTGTPAYLACDWGTTSLRAWVLNVSGAVVRSRDFPLGVGKLAPGEAAKRFRDEVRPGLVAEHLPAVLSGMIGSTLGWAVADYLDCPAGLSDLAAHLMQVDDEVWIAPGLRTQGLFGASDVIRGEETQILGWLHAEPSRLTGRRLICHPGTHAKWMLVEDGRIETFVTSMTGELFAVLTKNGVLKTEANPDNADGFRAGLEAAGDGSMLASRLFSGRARVVADGKSADESAAYLSGLLIGADAAATPKAFGYAGVIDVMGEPQLCRNYAAALEHNGLVAHIHDGDAASLAGLYALLKARFA